MERPCGSGTYVHHGLNLDAHLQAWMCGSLSQLSNRGWSGDIIADHKLELFNLQSVVRISTHHLLSPRRVFLFHEHTRIANPMCGPTKPSCRSGLGSLLRQGLLASYHLGTQLGHCIGAPRNAEVGQGSRRPSIGYVLAAIFIVGHRRRRSYLSWRLSALTAIEEQRCPVGS